MNSDISINKKCNSGLPICNILDPLSILLPIAIELLPKLHSILMLDGLQTPAYMKLEVKSAKLLPSL